MKNGLLYMVFLIGLCMANYDTPIYAQEEHEHEKSEAKSDGGKPEGHDEGEEDIVRLSAEDLKTFGIETAIVEPSKCMSLCQVRWWSTPIGLHTLCRVYLEWCKK